MTTRNSAKIEAGLNSIKELVQRMSAQAGMKLSSVHIDNGSQFDCTDAHILSMTSKGMTVFTKIFNSEIVSCSGIAAKQTEAKILNAIERLQVMQKG